MAQNIDILLDENEDLMIRDGDLVIGPSDDQHLRHNFMANKGSFRKVLVGFGATRFVRSTGNEIKFKRDLKEALSIDNYKLQKMELQPDGAVKVIADLK